MPQWGYGLALAAWHRNESKPPWIEALRPDLRELVRRNLKYLTDKKSALPVSPPSLDSRVGDHVRDLSTSELGLPEVIVPEDYNRTEYASSVRCVCPECHQSVQFPIECSGRIATCPVCNEDIDVPEHSNGRHEALLGQWNRRKALREAKNWEHHNLNAKWRLYFIGVAAAVVIPFWVSASNGELFAMFVGYVLGAPVAVTFTIYWYQLKELERNPDRLLTDSNSNSD
jgi:hypothetical protein